MTRARNGLHEAARLAVALAALGSALLAARGALGANLQDLAAAAKPSVVLLLISDGTGQVVGTGTGFFVSPDGEIVTNHHVIEGAAKVVARLADGREIESIGVLADDDERDLAIVKLPGSGFAALALGSSKNLRAGDDVVVLGSPKGLSASLSVGIVSAIRDHAHDPGEEHMNERDRKHVRWWSVQVTAPISPGSSGSPIMTSTGEVVAVAVGSRIGGEGLNFGIPVEEAKSLLVRARTAKLQTFETRAASGKWNLLVFFASVGVVVALAYLVMHRLERRRRRGAAPRRSFD